MSRAGHTGMAGAVSSDVLEGNVHIEPHILSSASQLPVEEHQGPSHVFLVDKQIQDSAKPEVAVTLLFQGLKLPSLPEFRENEPND